ncbi:5006_t:CDS:2 [Funneliformis mosseae]|uniref:5006_t:CDS:1 n=1 Tax=Funneliformis mosseae TaxID=27381 RepID=A0A9N8ZL45_FUNMO|nr:5006_t:CDS:2 [Funneliformis mosseae]
MSSLTPSTESTAHELTLFDVSAKETPLSDESTDPLHSEIMAYFISRGFNQTSLERQRLNPTIFVGIEGTGVSGVTSGDDKRLLVEWVLRKKQQMNSIIMPLITFSMMQTFHAISGSSYDDINTGIDNILSNNTKVADTNSTIYTIHSLDFGSDPSFCLNSSIENANNWIKNLSEGDDLWKKVVVASRCTKVSEVDNDTDTNYRTQDKFYLNGQVMVEMMLRVHGRMSFPVLNGSNLFDTFNSLLRLPWRQCLWTTIILALFIFIQNR